MEGLEFQRIQKFSTFSEITELKDYKVRVALAGAYHSLFSTTKGRVLVSGVNFDGELLLDSGPSNVDVLTPVKTSVHHRATLGITKFLHRHFSSIVCRHQTCLIT